jgi:hypothetical protein
VNVFGGNMYYQRGLVGRPEIEVDPDMCGGHAPRSRRRRQLHPAPRRLIAASVGTSA